MHRQKHKPRWPAMLDREMLHIPIIALTARAVAGDRMLFLERMGGYFAKPIRSRPLFDTIMGVPLPRNNKVGLEQKHVARD